MSWINFVQYAFISIFLSFFALLFLILKDFFNLTSRKIAFFLIFLSTIVIGAFLAQLWLKLGRPPMRTIGETRLWYSFFVPIIGGLTYFRWKNNVILYYSALISIIFLWINYSNPTAYNKSLMPALQSIWFIPHVLVYLFAYALLTSASWVAIRTIISPRSNQISKNIKIADNLVYIGFAFLSLGMFFGALWAKEAWGDYWAWDPKEIWAFLTWVCYLLYIHYRMGHPQQKKRAVYILFAACLFLLICWFGIYYLPAAQTSVHTYTQEL